MFSYPDKKIVSNFSWKKYSNTYKSGKRIQPYKQSVCNYNWYSAKKMWFIGVEAEQETSAPPLKKNPGSAPALERNETEQINIKSVIKRLRQQIISSYWV